MDTKEERKGKGQRTRSGEAHLSTPRLNLSPLRPSPTHSADPNDIGCFTLPSLYSPFVSLSFPLAAASLAFFSRSASAWMSPIEAFIPWLSWRRISMRERPSLRLLAMNWSVMVRTRFF